MLLRKLIRVWAVAGMMLGVTHSAAAAPFVFVALPDTQLYSENRFPDGRLPAVTDPRGLGAIFLDQTEWIVDNEVALDIRYVSHLGDIVQNGDRIEEWERAKEAMDLLLVADIPHGTVMGNHDDIEPPDYDFNYLSYFGPDVFADRPWYTAHSPNLAGNLQVLEHEGVKLGFLNFSIDHPQAELDWANAIIAANPDTIFIIGTHRYLYDLKLINGRYGEEVQSPLGPLTVGGGPIDGVIDPNTAQQLFEKVVSQHPNILMVHAGHFHSDLLRLDGLNSAQQTVIQLLTDYQSTRNGGDGYLRIYELDFDTNEFRFETYSPTLDRKRTVIDHYVESIFLAYDQRGQLTDQLGVSEDQYLLLLELAFKNQVNVPDGFLLQHPDFDTEEERAYYETYLNELFLGDPPEGFGNILDWEGLWMVAFAASLDPFDFSDWVRSPQGTLEIDFSQYFTPSEVTLAERFEALRLALAGLPDGDFTFPFARRLLDARIGFAAYFSGEDPLFAKSVLKHTVQRHVDGCARRGEPDSGFSFWWWFRWLRLDWVDTCSGQEAIYPGLVELIEALKEAGVAQ